MTWRVSNCGYLSELCWTNCLVACRHTCCGFCPAHSSLLRARGSLPALLLRLRRRRQRAVHLEQFLGELVGPELDARRRNDLRRPARRSVAAGCNQAARQLDAQPYVRPVSKRRAARTFTQFSVHPLKSAPTPSFWEMTMSADGKGRHRRGTTSESEWLWGGRNRYTGRRMQ